MKTQRIQRSQKTKHHSSDFFLPSHILSKFPIGGIRGMSLPLSLEIVATYISLDDNEGALPEVAVEGEETKNASCSEPGDENASCSELRGLQLPRIRRVPICADRSWAHGQRAMASRQGGDRLDLFPTTPERHSASFARAIGCSDPAIKWIFLASASNFPMNYRN